MHDFDKAVLIRYGEMWLKSDSVRRRFEQVLLGNIRPLFQVATKLSIVPGRVWVDSEKVPEGLSRVFGIVSYSSALVCEKDVEEIKSVAKRLTSKWKKGTFAIRARRSDKSFDLDSKQLEIAIAEDVNLPVDLSNPKHELYVEIRDKAYLFEKTLRGPGGLPLGSAGKAAAHLRDTDDLLATWLMMKRGMVPILLSPKPAMLKSLQSWAVGRKLKAVKSVGDAVRSGAIAMIDVKSGNVEEEGLVVLNPLHGFTTEEKAELLKRIKAR